MRVSWKAVLCGANGKGVFSDVYLATSFIQEPPDRLSADSFAQAVHAALAEIYAKDKHAIVIVSCSIGDVDLAGVAAQAKRMEASEIARTPLFNKWDSDVEIDLSRDE